MRHPWSGAEKSDVRSRWFADVVRRVPGDRGADDVRYHGRRGLAAEERVYFDGHQRGSGDFDHRAGGQYYHDEHDRAPSRTPGLDPRGDWGGI